MRRRCLPNAKVNLAYFSKKPYQLSLLIRLFCLLQSVICVIIGPKASSPITEMRNIQQLYNRRSIAVLCLIAFIMLIAISTIHTHISDDRYLHKNACSYSINGHSEANRCIACDLLLNGHGWAVTAIICFVIISTCIAWVIQLFDSVVCSANIYASSPRSPPSI